MSSRFWSVSPSAPSTNISGAHPSSERRRATCWIAAGRSSRGKATAHDSRVRSIVDQAPSKYRNTRSFLKILKELKLLSCGLRSRRSLVPSSSVQTAEKREGRQHLMWVTTHLELTAQHSGTVKNEEGREESQRWGIILGHTIETDIYPMCPKGEKL